MLQKKICMLGFFGVGKTSLVRRYVCSVYSDTYLTTVGVKIDKKTVTVREQTLDLLLWDIAGEDVSSALRTSYVAAPPAICWWPMARARDIGVRAVDARTGGVGARTSAVRGAAE